MKMTTNPALPVWGHMDEIDASTIARCLTRLVAGKAARGDTTPLRILEIGTWMGRTARGMYEFSRNLGVDVYLAQVDPYDYTQEHVGGPLWTAPEGGFFNMKSIEAAAKTTPLHLYPTMRYFDFVFIDGCHCPVCVFHDLVSWRSRVVAGGIMAFHDTTPNIGSHPQHEGWCGYSPGVMVRPIITNQILLPPALWEVVEDKYDPENTMFGVTAFMRKPDNCA